MSLICMLLPVKRKTYLLQESALLQILGINPTVNIFLLIELLLDRWIIFSLTMVETRVEHNFSSSSAAT